MATHTQTVKESVCTIRKNKSFLKTIKVYIDVINKKPIAIETNAAERQAAPTKINAISETVCVNAYTMYVEQIHELHNKYS